MANKEYVSHGAVVLVRADGAVLINHRDNRSDVTWPDHWTYLGGRLHDGESPKDGAMRELTEETGYAPDENTLFPLTSEVCESTDGTMIRRHVFWTHYDGRQEIQCNEGQEMRFMHIEELADKKTIPGQIEIMQKAIQAAQSVNEKPAF